MKNNYLYKVLLICFISIGLSQLSFAQNNTNECNDNTYVNSIDPDTIEYDNVVSVFHSTLIREADGKVKVWGAGIASNGTSNVLSPQVLNNINYPNLTGTILKFAAGSTSGSTLDSVVQQFAVLTTDGLFIWGRSGILISSSIKSSTGFERVTINGQTNGLPSGVSPEDVKMMFGSYRTLTIVTYGGQAFVLSFNGDKNGDGTSQNNTNDVKWHQVKINATGNPYLTNVVAVRGVNEALMALTSGGDIYTWGSKTYLGDNTSQTARTYATKMTVPAGVTPKMIGMTSASESSSTSGVSYYLLSTAGDLYSLGENGYRQLGDFTTTDRKEWVRVKKSSAANDYLTNIAWVSPQEHDASSKSVAVSILTENGKLWSWGNNFGLMLGLSSENTAYNPTYMPGKTSGAYNETKLNETDVLMALETGGHTTIVIKECSMRFGYVGHRVHGSMADGTNDNTNESIFNFGETAIVNLCGASTGPIVQDLRICEGTLANLDNAHLGTLPPGDQLKWYTTSTREPGSQVANPSAVPPGIYYAFYEPGGCPTPPGSEVHVDLIQPDDPDIGDCVCARTPIFLQTGTDTNIGISAFDRDQSSIGDHNQWPKNRKSGFIAIESSTKGFVITRMTTAELANITHPQEGMMVYDKTTKSIKIYSDNSWESFDQPSCD